MFIFHASFELLLKELLDVLIEVLDELLLLCFGLFLQLGTHFLMFLLEFGHFFLAVVELRFEVDLDLVLEGVYLFLEAIHFTLLCPDFFLKFEGYHLVVALCDLALC